jgi:hypothetical protein
MPWTAELKVLPDGCVGVAPCWLQVGGSLVGTFCQHQASKVCGAGGCGPSQPQNIGLMENSDLRSINGMKNSFALWGSLANE